ncbi:MAG: rod shape-determining protein [Pseudomonadota bacterium]
MFKAFKPILYIQLSPQQLSVRNLKTGETLAEVPEVAIAYDPAPRVLGMGAEARAFGAEPSVELINPFGHPRSLVSDFIVGEQLLKAFIRRALGRSLLTIAPRVVMHPLGDPAGGFTQVELRALREMALGAGACEVVIWRGRGLTDAELGEWRFPSEGELSAG